MGGSGSQPACEIAKSDPRLDGKSPLYEVKNKYGSVDKSTSGKPEKLGVALAITYEGLVIDLLRGKPLRQQQCASVRFNDPLFRDMKFEYKDGDHKEEKTLIITLLDAKRFQTSPQDLPENCTLKISVSTYLAPDIVMHALEKQS
mmetsp:Transcript_38004/g.60214  ORF Transcript_38004/g.60214 Transcript_38004/m.60214 type:complete len:145 (+) Transcript_38004:107-541(+)